MTIYEQGFREGYEQGYREGGIALLTEQLALKFGELPRHYLARLQAATVEDIERYAERIFTADTLAAMFGEPS